MIDGKNSGNKAEIKLLIGPWNGERRSKSRKRKPLSQFIRTSTVTVGEVHICL